MKKIFLLLILVVAFYSIMAQLPQAPVIQSPNVASLGTFGSIPISYNTGTPDISIPIYTVQSGSITVPIALRYHPASVRPNEHPGWVGLGWSLQSAGIITRKKNNIIDEFESESIADSYYDHGRFILDDADWDSHAKLKNYYVFHNNKITDVEPDEFIFNFLGYSGKFILTANGWQVISDQDIKVEVNSFIKENIAKRIKHNLNFPHLTPLEYPRNYFQFTLTTADGTQYVFGGLDSGGEDAVEYTINYESNITHYTASAWHLIRIIDTNNRIVDFKYHRKYPIASLSYFSSAHNFSCNGGYDWSYSNVSTSTHGGVAIFPVYLDEIISETNDVKFLTSYSDELKYPDNYLRYFRDYGQEVNANWLKNYGDQFPDYDNLKWEQLDEMQIKDKRGGLLKKYIFQYNPSSTQRLTLDYLKEQSPSSISNQIYEFKYNNIAGLPPYGGDKTDHWGFFNNRSVNGISFAELTNGVDKNKNTDVNVVTTGLLNTIVFPTGGYTEFDWEAHQYGKVLSTSKLSLDVETGYAGGSRIREIRSYANASTTPIVKTYYYLSNFTGSPTGLSSSGVLNGRPQYFIPNNIRMSAGGNHSVAYYEASVHSTVSYGMNTQGTHIGYKEVVEKSSDGSYTKYEYTSYDSDIYGITHYDKPAKTIGWIPGDDRFITSSSLARERGKLIRLTHFTNTNQPIQRILYTYNNDPNRFNDYIRSTENRLKSTCSPYDGLVLGAAFLEYKYRYNVSTETVIDYNESLHENSKMTSYVYNDFGMVSEKKTYESDGNVLQTIYKYPTDYDYNKSALESDCNNTYSYCNIEARNSRDRCYSDCGGQSSCMAGCESAWNGERSLCDVAYANCMNAIPNSATIQLKEKHIYSRVIEEQTRIIYPDNSIRLLEGKFYRYNRINSLILLSSVLQIETNTPISDLTESSINANGIMVLHPKYQTVAVIDKYDVRGNILQYHEANGINKSYTWSDERPLPLSATVNAKSTDVFFDSFEEETPGWSTSLIYDNTFSHTGQYSGKIVKATSGELYSHSSHWLNVSLIAPTKFKYSGWVYSDGPSADIYLFMKTASEGSYYTIIDHVSTSSVGKWVFLEREYTVPANISKLNIRIDNNGGGTVWFDDIRLHPSDARMTTYTYDANSSLTSESDADNDPIYYEYDLFNRLKLVRDQENKILKQYKYHLQGQY